MGRNTGVKIVVVLGILLITGAILFHFGFFSDSEDSNTVKPTDNSTVQQTPDTTKPSTSPTQNNTKPTDTPTKTTELRISLDEWHGWKGVVYANKGVNDGGNDSIYTSLGVDVDISVINDDEESLQAFLNGDVVAIGQSVNEFPYICARAKEVGVDCKMVLLTDKSIGGDAIVSTKNITSIEGLAGHKIAVAEYSASHIMLEWLLKASSLTNTELGILRSNMLLTSSTEETYEVLKQGKADVAVLWEPFVTQAKHELNANVVFSTKSASNLMLDGIVFRSDYIKENSEAVEKFIEGALLAVKDQSISSDYMKEFESYADLNDAEIAEMESVVSFLNYADNQGLFDGVVQTLYKEMAIIWEDLGVDMTVLASGAFDGSHLSELSVKFSNDVETKTNFSEEDRDKASSSIDTSTLLKQTLTINFEPNLAIIQSSSYDVLNEFVQTAKILNGAIIQIEGNIADTGIGDTPAGRLLSEQRAKAVYDYLKERGIEESRMLTKGWGNTNPVPGLDPRSQDGMAANRRTDIFFLKIE